jgi:peptidoglycan/LPS O-acetylase OafA/YrhL
LNVPPGAGEGYVPRICHATDTRLDSILLGCILAIQGNPVLDGTRVSKQHWLFLWLPLAVAALLFTFVCRESWFRETWRYTIQGLAMFPIFIATIRYPDWAPFRVLNWGPVKWLGLMSYTLYLTHSSIHAAITQWLPDLHPFVQGSLTAGLSLGVAAAMYRWVEKPCADLRKRLSKPRPVPQAELTAALPSEG